MTNFPHKLMPYDSNTVKLQINHPNSPPKVALLSLLTCYLSASYLHLSFPKQCTFFKQFPFINT